MAEVIITKTLVEEINKTFKGEAVEVFELIYTLRENPLKGKPVGNVSGTIIKELRYKSFRFYFIAEGFKLKVLDEKELKNILIKFVRRSNKKEQQKVIDEIKLILKKIGEEGF